MIDEFEGPPIGNSQVEDFNMVVHLQLEEAKETKETKEIKEEK